MSNFTPPSALGGNISFPPALTSGAEDWKFVVVGIISSLIGLLAIALGILRYSRCCGKEVFACSSSTKHADEDPPPEEEDEEMQQTPRGQKMPKTPRKSPRKRRRKPSA